VVQRLPLIVVGELNGFAFSTAPERQMKGHLSARSQGAFTETVDGNDPVAVFEAAGRARARCLAGEGPVFLVCETFRLGGHAEHDHQHYVDPELKALWAARDPIRRLETWLEERGWTPPGGLRPQLEDRVAAAAEQTLAEPEASPGP
jgi:TPP-dependent pyruvate/acetoin dehydrogenase alpha subunit